MTRLRELKEIDKTRELLKRVLCACRDYSETYGLALATSAAVRDAESFLQEQEPSE